MSGRSAPLGERVIMLVAAAVVVYVVMRLASPGALPGERPPAFQLRPGIIDPLPPIESLEVGQSGMPPCWFSPVFLSSDATAEGRIDDCPVLIPGLEPLNVAGVNLETGAFVHVATDAFVQARPVIALIRVARPVDFWTRRFSVYLGHLYDAFIVGDRFPYTYIELVAADGRPFRYGRISEGTGYDDALYRHEDTRTLLYGSTHEWNGAGWDLEMRDGTTVVFPDGYRAARPQQGAPIAMRDRDGNALRFDRNALGDLQRVVAEDGQWMELQHAGDHVVRIEDSLGEWVLYEYDDLDRVSRVETESGATSYVYDRGNRIAEIRWNGVVRAQNEYDRSGRILRHTVPGGESYQFTYGSQREEVQETSVVSSRGWSVLVRIRDGAYDVIEGQ